jgi:lipopolysaccharide transport system ATP-binding protein
VGAPHIPLFRRLRAWVKGETAVMHVTHWKAGSQWIKKILRECCPHRVIPGGLNSVNLTAAPIRRGAVYAPVYATRQTIDQLSLPSFVRRFAVIRDPRDSVVSLYYSTKISHDVIAPVIQERRDQLQALDVDKGLQYLIRESTAVGDIIRSWLGGPDPVIRYEDLLGNDEAILERVLLDHCQLSVSRQTLLEAIRNNRFEALTKGRRRGEENVAVHERKGIAGDWRNHFSEATKQTFKECFGNILVEAGYETSNDW